MDSAYTFQCKKQLSFLKHLFFSPSERGWVRALGEARASGNHLLSAPTPASVWVRLGWSRQSGHLLHSISAAAPCPGRSPTRGSWAAAVASRSPHYHRKSLSPRCEAPAGGRLQKAAPRWWNSLSAGALCAGGTLPGRLGACQRC